MPRYRVCATPGCRCTADPPQRHGPYWQHTRKVAGKTVTTLLTGEQAERYQEWVINRRRLDELIAEMKEVSEQARQLLLAQISSPGTGRGGVPPGGVYHLREVRKVSYMACALNLLRLEAFWNGTPLDRRRTSHLARLELTLAA